MNQSIMQGKDEALDEVHPALRSAESDNVKFIKWPLVHDYDGILGQDRLQN